MTLLTVGETTRATGLSIDTLRYYEREQLLWCERSSSGHRRYREADLGWIRLLTCLRDTGMPIRRMREFALQVRQDEANLPERIALLEAHRTWVLEHIRDLERKLGEVEVKIAHYGAQLGT